jgi:hypothetical protein
MWRTIASIYLFDDEVLQPDADEVVGFSRTAT